MKDFHPNPGIDYSEISVTSLSQLLEPGFMEALIVAGRAPFEYGHASDNPRKPKGIGNDGWEEYERLWHRYVVVPPPGFTRDSKLGIYGIGNFYFYDEQDKQLPSPQTFDLNVFGTRLFRKRNNEALKAVPLSLGPKGRDVIFKRLTERLGF